MSSSPTDTTLSRSGPRPRPTFSVEVPLSPAEILTRVQAALSRSQGLSALHLDEGKIDLLPAEELVHVWSPQLSLVLRPHEGGTRIDARFGPNPHIWALYLASYAISVLLAIGCAMFGLAQLVLGQSPWVLYLTPVAILLAALVYGASYVGQGLGSAQMCELRHFLSTALED